MVGIQWEGLAGRHSVGGAGSKAITGRGWVIGWEGAGLYSFSGAVII